MRSLVAPPADAPMLANTPLMKLDRFGVAFGDRIVLTDVTFDVPAKGMLTIVGPAGAGKSALLRTLAGLNDAHPALTTWGEVQFHGWPLMNARSLEPGEPRRGVELVMQHAKFYTASVRENLVSALPNRGTLDRPAQTAVVRELLRGLRLDEVAVRLDDEISTLDIPLQRRLAIARAVVSNPDVLLADEPTATLDDHDAAEILALLRSQARERAVIFVTHNQRLARASGGLVVLLSGGRVCEVAPAEAFFENPKSPQAREFIASGNSSEPGPNAEREDLDPSRPPPPALPEEALRARSRFEGPRGFFWVKPGRLGGLPRPGIVDTVERDLEGLRRLGVTTLVTLEETLTVPPAVLVRFGITCVPFPVKDMGVPTLEAGAQLAQDLDRRLRAGEIVAVHCRAGLGRTGTTLAAQLVSDGESARAAIERVRRIQPLCIQSEAQVAFLSSFEAFLAKDPRAAGRDTCDETPPVARSPSARA